MSGVMAPAPGAIPTLKLCSCSEASLCRRRQELKMSSSVSRSQTFSSLMRVSSCSSSELVSGESAERGSSAAATAAALAPAFWLRWDRPGPECSERIFCGEQ